MKLNIFFILITFNLAFSSNSDTIIAISIKNINLRENATTDSKVITEIKPDDTLIITETENGWSKAIYKDTLNGFVKSEFVKEISSRNETLKLLVLNKLFKSYFLKALFLISLLCFGVLYLLKSRLLHIDIIGNLSLVIKSFLIGFIITIIGTLYFFYDLFSFFKIVGVVILLVFLYYRISSIFKIEKLIKEDKVALNNNSKENLKNISKEIVREQITNENNKLAETKSNLDNAISKTNEIKRQQFNLIKEKLTDLYGAENTNELINRKKPFVGLHKTFIKYFIGDYDDINEKSDAINKWETYLYDKGKYNRWRLKIHILNNLVTNYEINNDYK